MSQPDVSVVVPTYKPRPVIEQAIESILDQTSRPTPIVVVDDASPAEYQPYLDRLDERYPIRLVRRRENGGPAAAHNTGIAATKSQYVAFLEHDDLWLPTKVEKQVAAMEDHPDWGVCYVGVLQIGPDGEEAGSPDDRYYPEDLVLKKMLKGNCIHTISAVMLRKKCLDETGGFDSSFRWAGDYDLWLRIASGNKWRIGCVSEELTCYRIYDNNWSLEHPGEVMEEAWRAIYACCKAQPHLWPMAADQYSTLCYRMAQYRTTKARLFDALLWNIRGCRVDSRMPMRYLRWFVSRMLRPRTIDETPIANLR